jgi:16S rRNA (adenine1518-N6/adenine1519-N6)-dimethyltransferase
MKVPAFSQDARLDQVFMKDDDVLESIVSFACLRKSETVLEIGAGTGNLTKMLAKGSKRVITIEIDERLRPALRRQFGKMGNVRIVWGNALEVLEKEDLMFDKVVSNPPYSISEPLIRALFGKRFKSAILTLPWRFVERLTANPEEGNYSKLSMFAQAFFRIETLLPVPAGAWSPTPDTASVVIRLAHREASSASEAVLRQLVLQSDKKLKNALREAIIKAGPGKGTKRLAKDAMEGAGLPKKLVERKISEMGLDDIKAVMNKVVSMLEKGQ